MEREFNDQELVRRQKMEDLREFDLDQYLYGLLLGESSDA